MKKWFLLCVVGNICLVSLAQNVGIGTTNPATKLDVTGSFRATAVSSTVANAPTPAQTYTMVNAVTTEIPNTDSTCRIYDPGGPSGNYLAGLESRFYIMQSQGSEGFDLLIENFSLGNGDSLFLHNGPTRLSPIIAALGPGSNVSGFTYRFSSSSAYGVFRSNNDASVGAGFSLLVKRKYFVKSDSIQGNYAGKMLWFNAEKGSLRSGKIVESDTIGNYSIGLGHRVNAPGDYSLALGSLVNATKYAAVAIGEYADATADNAVAIGRSSEASGPYAVAIGSATVSSFYGTVAIGSGALSSGNYSVAIGSFPRATGDYGVALGKITRASGDSSTAMGGHTVASGDGSTAMGGSTEASGLGSTALGRQTTASGNTSTALGFNTTASGSYSLSAGHTSLAYGNYSVAMGRALNATGANATAFGYNNTASGDYSTAMGRSVNTAGNAGSFIIGDNQTTLLSNTAANQMMMRFAGGYRLYSNAAANVGVSLAAGANSWATISDYRKKENYVPANGNALLQKISNMQLGSWNYIGQDKKAFRHYGPMAQEFYKHFGNDGIGTIGNDTTIATADIDGVMMIAIQALVKENEELKKRLDKLEAFLTKEHSTSIKNNNQNKK